LIWFYLVFAVLSFCAAFSDLLFFRIPNSVVLAIFGVFILKVLVFPNVNYPYLPFLVFAMTLILGYLLYAFKIMGAGDVKFLSVASMWATPTELIGFIFMVCISGGILAIIYLNYNHWINLSQVWIISSLSNLLGKDNFKRVFGEKSLHMMVGTSKNNQHKISPLMPYGVAIFFGCCFVTATKIWG